MTLDELVSLFNKNNDDLALHRVGSAVDRRRRQVERWLAEPVISRPHDAWPILDAHDRPDGAMEYLGAYLVEDFVRLHGVEFLDLLETAARESPRWRRVLGAAYGWTNPKRIDPRVASRLEPYIGKQTS
jgi:hypothetical protein